MKIINILKAIGLISVFSFSLSTLTSCDENTGSENTGSENTTVTEVARVFQCDGGTTFFGDIPETTLFLDISADQQSYIISDGTLGNNLSVSGDLIFGSITELVSNADNPKNFDELKGLTQNGNYVEILFTGADYELVVHDNSAGTSPISAREGNFVEIPQ